MRKYRNWIYAALLSICMALFLITVPASAAETVKTVSTEADLTSALADSNVSEIKLTGDIEISNTLTVNRTVTLDLNGCVLRMTGQKSVIKVESNGDLTIQDSNASASHRFTPNSDGLWVLNETDGTKTVSGGVITGGVASEQKPTVGGTYLYCGGGVSVKTGGKLIMTGGNIVGCRSEDYGGGVSVMEGGELTMTGGSIAGCTAEWGGGIACYDENNTMTISGTALIRDCRAYRDGGGIWIHGKLLMMGAAAIRGCIARDSGVSSMHGKGGGVYVHSNSSLVMSDSAVTEDCKAVTDMCTKRHHSPCPATPRC